jgi:hypothetical protein
MSDTVMVMVGAMGWVVALGLVWWLDWRRGEIVAGATDRIVSSDERLRLAEVHIAGVADQFDKYDDIMRDLNLRVARAEATIAATPTPPDPATIIAAATAPLLALTEQYTAPHQFPAPANVAGGVEEGEWTAEELAAYDPTDEDFPPYRAPDDYSPPAGFGGLGIDLPRLEK